MSRGSDGRQTGPAGRDFIGRLLVSLTFGLLFIGGVIADCWLLWDKDKQELWEKISPTPSSMTRRSC